MLTYVLWAMHLLAFGIGSLVSIPFVMGIGDGVSHADAKAMLVVSFYALGTTCFLWRGLSRKSPKATRWLALALYSPVAVMIVLWGCRALQSTDGRFGMGLLVLGVEVAYVGLMLWRLLSTSTDPDSIA